MAATDWTLTIPGFDDAEFISVRFDIGRKSVYDDFTACYMIVQARNNSDQAYYLSMGAYCTLTTPNMYLGPLGWWIVGWEYEDGYDPEQNFVTIRLISSYGYIGRDSTINTVPGTTWTALDQIDYLYNTLNQRSGLPPYIDVPLSGSQFAYAVPTGTNVATFMQNAVRTEWGRVYEYGQTVTFAPLDTYNSAAILNIGITSSSTSLIWDTFLRSGADIDSFQQVTASPTSGQYTAYSTGTAQQLSLTTNHATQPVSYATGIANSIKPDTRPNSAYPIPPRQFVVQITDGAQHPDALEGLETWLPFAPATLANVTYYDTRFATTTYLCMIEGASVEIVAGLTRYVLYLTEANGYPLFILDNSELGVLDENRLGF